MQKYLNQAVDLYKSQWQKVLLLAVISQLPVMIADYAGLMMTGDEIEVFSWIRLGVTIAVTVWSIIFSLAIVFLVKYTTDDIKTLLKKSSQRFLPYIWTGFLTMILAILVIAIPIAIFAFLNALALAFFSSFQTFIVSILQFVLGLGTFIVVIYYAFRLNFILQSVAISHKIGKSAIEHSLRVTQKKFWKIFVAIIAIAILFIAINFVPYGLILIILLSPLVSLFMTYMFLDFEKQYLEQSADITE